MRMYLYWLSDSGVMTCVLPGLCVDIMDSRQTSVPYRQNSGGTPVNDTRGGAGGQRYLTGGGRNGVRGERRPRERDGRDQRMRGGRGRVRGREEGNWSQSVMSGILRVWNE